MCDKNFKIYMLVLACAGLLAGCGSSETDEATARGTFTVSAQKSVFLKSFGAQSFAFNRSSEDSDQLVQVDRLLPLSSFDAHVQPDQTLDERVTYSVVTGIGMDVENLDGEPLDVSIAIVARKFDITTGQFSGATRTFYAPGADFTNSQSFFISNTDYSNNLLSGLGLALRDARVKQLVLQRKAIGNLYSSGTSMSTRDFVSVDAGWAAVGFHIRIRPKDRDNDRTPFVQDALIYTAQLTFWE